jgi:hypothetical protein
MRKSRQMMRMETQMMSEIPQMKAFGGKPTLQTESS